MSLDLDRARRFYEEVLGLECARLAPDRLIARHRSENAGNYWILDVRQVDKIERPQTTCNHWGVFVKTHEEIDRAHEFVSQNKARYGLHRVQKPMTNHGSYSFYIIDLDTNWWELECRPETRAYGSDVTGAETKS